jgi:integrase
MLPWQEAPAAIARLQASDSMAAPAVELAALCGLRISDAREATWSEIDFDSGLWTIPAERMKMKARDDHIVPLSTQALALLRELQGVRTGPFVFPGYTGAPVARHGCWEVAKRISDGVGTTHGWRAMFKSWCTAHGVADEVSEIAMAHKVGGVKGLYQRDQLVERRAPVMRAWGAFLSGEMGAEVVPLRGAA